MALASSISNLPAATSLAGTDVFPIVQGGVTKKASLSLYKEPVPVLRAYPASNTAVNTVTYTKVALNTKAIDTEGYFDTVLYRYTPLIAGYYEFVGQVMLDSGAIPPASSMIALIYLNGVSAAQTFTSIVSGIQNDYCAEISTILQMNGSTDYVELYAYHNIGNARNVLSGSPNTYLTGKLVRAT